MIKLLPFILIPVLIVGGLGIWRYTALKQNLVASQSESSRKAQEPDPVEVPKTLPDIASEDTKNKPVSKASSKPAGSQDEISSTLDSRLTALEIAVAGLKNSVTVLEQGTTTTAGSVKSSTVYIPLGTGGGGGDKGWNSMSNYGATIDPAEYPGYSNMQLEVNFRLIQKSGTAYARLYNTTDSTSKGEVSTTADAFSWHTSSGFTLPAGKKTYTLQMKSIEGADVQFQSARIKVNF